MSVAGNFISDVMSKAYDTEETQERDARNLTGIRVYARDVSSDTWRKADLSELTIHSLMKWFRSGGERNQQAERVAAILMGHQVSAVEKYFTKKRAEEERSHSILTEWEYTKEKRDGE